MHDQDSKPVVLLIYAKTGVNLEMLKSETEAIESHLKSSGLCEVRIVPNATLAEVVSAINEPALRDRVAIVHYAGHANGQGIQLQSSNAILQGETAYMRGLAEVLKQQPHLRLLFINGCASREQVLELTQAGIPLVIATNRGIDDKVACDFAEYFYRTIGQQRSIVDAFQVAAGELKATAGTNMRGLYFGEYKASFAATNSELPWELHGPDADRHWSLREPYYRGTGPRWDHTKFSFNPESPYLGLRYFAEEDSSRFFGRDEFIQTLLTSSESAPLLLVIGASGTGKSSVVRAGMIPGWKKQHRGASQARAFVFTPQDDPFEQLSTALASVDTFDRQQIRRIREAPSRTALWDAVKTFGQGEPWLFCVDQFEQIFTRTINQRKRADFLDAITDLARSEHPNVRLVLAMRDDFFPHLRDYPELSEFTDKHCFRVAALSRAALQEVIERPAAENGVSFPPGLVVKIIDTIDRQPGALPLLQYALNALWKKEDSSNGLQNRLLNESTYYGLGGVTGSLGRRLQDLYDQQDDAGKDQFRWMMLKLVTYDGTRAVSQLALKSEFGKKQTSLMDQLIANGLLVSSDSATPSLQLGHEKIIEAWPEFTKWAQECREANIIRQQLSKAASKWAELKAKKERQRRSRALWQGSQLEKALELRKRGDFEQLGGLVPNDNQFLDECHSHSQRMIRTLTVLLAVAVGAAVFGWWSYNRAEMAAYRADSALQDTRSLLSKTVQIAAKYRGMASGFDQELLVSAQPYYSRILADTSSVSSHIGEVAEANFVVALALNSQEQKEDACKFLNAARASFDVLGMRPQLSENDLRLLTVFLMDEVDLRGKLESEKNPAEELLAYEQAEKYALRLNKEFGKTNENQELLSTALINIAGKLHLKEDFEGAIRRRAEAIAVLAPISKDNNLLKLRMAEVQHNQAMGLMILGRTEEANANRSFSLKNWDELPNSDSFLNSFFDQILEEGFDLANRNQINAADVWLRDALLLAQSYLRSTKKGDHEDKKGRHEGVDRCLRVLDMMHELDKSNIDAKLNYNSIIQEIASLLAFLEPYIGIPVDPLSYFQALQARALRYQIATTHGHSDFEDLETIVLAMGLDL